MLGYDLFFTTKLQKENSFDVLSLLKIILQWKNLNLIRYLP